MVRPKFADQSLKQIVQSHLTDGASVRQSVAEECTPRILRAADMLARAFIAKKKLLLCGSGGSAADCQHMATELVSRLNKDFRRPGLPAIALTTDTSFLTAFANDEGFDDVFARQIQALGVAGDVLICISTSGTSTNVERAALQAKEQGMVTILLTGAALEVMQSDIVIAVPSTDTQHIQESHLAIEHILCDLVERHVFKKP